MPTENNTNSYFPEFKLSSPVDLLEQLTTKEHVLTCQNAGKSLPSWLISGIPSTKSVDENNHITGFEKDLYTMSSGIDTLNDTRSFFSEKISGFSQLMKSISNPGDRKLSPFILRAAYLALGRFTLRTGAFTSAPKLLLSHLSVQRSIGDQTGISVGCGLLSEFYLLILQPSTALAYINESYERGSQRQRLRSYAAIAYALDRDFERAYMMAKSAMTTQRTLESTRQPFGHLNMLKVALLEYLDQQNQRAEVIIRQEYQKLGSIFGSHQSLISTSAYSQAHCLLSACDGFHGTTFCNDISSENPLNTKQAIKNMLHAGRLYCAASHPQFDDYFPELNENLDKMINDINEIDIKTERVWLVDQAFSSTNINNENIRQSSPSLSRIIATV